MSWQIGLPASLEFTFLSLPSLSCSKKINDLESVTYTKPFTERLRVAQKLELDEALSTSMLQCHTRNVNLTEEIIKVKVEVFYECLGLPEGTIKFSCGCLQCSRTVTRCAASGFTAQAMNTDAARMRKPWIQHCPGYGL